MNERISSRSRPADRPSPDELSTTGQSQARSIPATILLIDDNPAVSRAMEIAFRLAGHRLEVATGPEEALSRLSAHRYGAILLDLNFTAGESSGEEGLALLARLVSDDPAACVVVITAHSGIRIAVTAMQAGARDFVMKPWRNAELIAKVEAAMSRTAPTERSAASLRASPERARLLGESSAMRHLREVIGRVGPTLAGVTVTGPPGSGRTLAALSVHAASPHAERPPVRIDLRDEGAWQRLDQATDSAILHHVDQLDAVAQGRLLERIDASLRCIAIADDATSFTPALRRRIATLEIAMPPLAAREDDPILLARHFARLAAERFGRAQARLTDAAEAAVRATIWPHEVSGLALAVERAVLLSQDGIIDAAALALPGSASETVSETTEADFDLTDAERAMIKAALHRHHHNVTHAASALGLSRGALYRRMERHGL